MSKSLKTIVAVAASIAIPFAAPAIASSIGLSAAIGATAGSALVGAGLGAANASLTGGDIGRGALMGGIGGGVGGYTQPTGVAGGAVGGTGLTSPTAATTGSQYALTGGGGTGLTMGGAGAGLSYGGEAAGALGGAATGTAAGTGLSGAATDYAFTPDYSLAFTAPTATTGIAGTAGTAGTAGAPRTFTEALSRTGDAIKAKFADPKNLADMTLRAAGQLAGSALAGSGLSPEEEALLGQQTEELRQLQQTNQALFNQRLEQAQSLAGESKYFDPEYFGLQRARKAQTAGAVAKRAGLRGLTGERRQAEGRRYDLETGRNTGTAYDVGFGATIAPRLQTQQAGLAAMPGYMDYRTPALTAQLGAQGVARTRRAEDREGIADMFGPLYK